MSQCSLLNVTVHPTSHSTLTPIKDAIDRLGTMCPVSISGSPGIVMSQQWVDLILVPSGKLMVRGLVAIRLFSTGVPSMIKMAVAPVSIIAWDNFCRHSCPGAPKRARAVAAIVCRGTYWLGLTLLLLCRDLTAVVVLDVIMVTSSSSTSSCVLLIWVGVGESTNVRFILSATCNSAPTCQNPAGNWFLCCPLMDAACPAAMYCCTFCLLHPSWCPGFRQSCGHVADVCPSSTSNPHEKQ